MNTLKSLRTESLSWWDEAGNTSTTATNIDNAIRKAHHRRVTGERWPFMLYPPQRFSFVANQQDYALHQEYSQPLYFFNRTKKEFLEQLPPRQLTDDNLDWVDGTADNTFLLQGVMPVAAQPSSSSTLSLVSSDAGDTGSAKALIIRGETASGVVSETLAPNGTTPVVSTNAFTHIISLTLTDVWAGTLSLTSNEGAVANLTLLAGEYGRQYQRMRLLWLPSAGDVIEYQFFRKPSPLTNDYDIPDIPYPHSGILVWDALLTMAAYDNQTEGGRLAIWRANQQEAEAALLKAYLEPQAMKARGRYVKYRGD